MNIEEYSFATGLINADELEKVKFLAFYFHKTEGKMEFSSPDVAAWFSARHFSQPNMSRLTRKIRESSSFIKGSANGFYRLHAIELDDLQSQFPGLSSGSEEVVSDDTILPKPIYENTRGFVESLAKQINASFEYNIFDGSAVLMRRLLEILLILSYEHLNIEAEIQDNDGNYVPLERIITNAKSNKSLRLSRDTKKVLEEFRKLGNFSAHKIYYNCRRRDLVDVLRPYRAAVEELMYKCGIRK